MNEQIFPYANLIAGILILVVGFLFHFVGQMISLLNSELAVKIGIWEKDLIPEFEVYEKAIATADVIIGLSYGAAAIGLLFNANWAYNLAWIPASVLVYHGLSYWFWVGNQTKAGYPLYGLRMRIGWSIINLITGIFISHCLPWRHTSRLGRVLGKQSSSGTIGIL